jgi:hypothetical protein
MTRLRVAAALVMSLAATAGAQPKQAPDLSTKSVVAKAEAYVREYQTQLAYLLADETYVQRAVTSVRGRSAVESARTMRSEVFFVFLPGIEEWMAVRDVISVDGTDVPNRRDVQALLQGAKPMDTARAVKDDNARFNLGRVIRNFNEPTLALMVLDRRYRPNFKFQSKQTVLTAGAYLVTLAFSEQDGPTLIHDTAGHTVRSQGELVVDAATGRIAHAWLKLAFKSIEARLDTRFARNEHLDLWLPSLFSEHYVEGETSQDIECAAVYSNFRRFGVQVRIK